jgi:hypothetical protein
MMHSGGIQHAVSLAATSEWGVGGVARALYTPADEADATAFLAALRTDEPLLVLGQGSFMVVRDGGFPGMVMRTAGLDRVREEDGGLYVEAGARCAQVAHAAARAQLGGYEWLAGVPGTIGGALMTHAGLDELRVWDQVLALQMLDRGGHAHRRSRESFGMGPVRAGGNRHAGETIAGVWLKPAEAALANVAGQLSGPRAIGQLFAAGDVAAVGACAEVLDGPVRLDRDSGQLHLDAGADATALEAAIEQLCAAAGRRAGRDIACRLRFAGLPRDGMQHS